MEVSDLKTILSAVFIVFGSGVFYISSLIAGHNIYKDLSFNLAMMVTTIIGFILFIFSPISFVILFPEMFDNLAALLVKLNKSGARERTDITDTVNRIHELILNDLLLDFVLMAFGLGLLLGCFSAVGARAAILQWFRSITGLKFPIYTYSHTWDHLLMRVKSHGRVVVRLEDGEVEGQLVVHSVKDEPRQIVLRHYTVKTSNGSSIKSEPADEFLITDLCKIKGIQVPSTSFNLHRDLFTHTTQSFYTALSALGILAISISFMLTANFLSHHTFPRLTTTYNTLSFFSLLLLSVMTLTSDRLYKKDFCSWATAAVCYPATLIINVTIIFLAPIILHGFMVPFPTGFLVGYASVYIGLIGYIIGKRRHILIQFDAMYLQVHQTGIFKNVINDIHNCLELKQDGFREHYVLQRYIDKNVNKSTDTVLSTQEDVRVQLNKMGYTFKTLLDEFGFLWFPKGFLVVDEINLLILFENHVTIKEKEQAAHQAQFGK